MSESKTGMLVVVDTDHPHWGAELQLGCEDSTYVMAKARTRAEAERLAHRYNRFAETVAALRSAADAAFAVVEEFRRRNLGQEENMMLEQLSELDAVLARAKEGK